MTCWELPKVNWQMNLLKSAVAAAPKIPKSIVILRKAVTSLRTLELSPLPTGMRDLPDAAAPDPHARYNGGSVNDGVVNSHKSDATWT